LASLVEVVVEATLKALLENSLPSFSQNYCNVQIFAAYCTENTQPINTESYPITGLERPLELQEV
jgi:hypothetical protein